MTRAYVGLGSNLDNPLVQLRQATLSLAEIPQTRLIKTSSIYQSQAVGPGDQSDYLNAVVALETALEPFLLLRQLQGIEDQQGRVRRERWGARTLDLDLLLYGAVTLESKDLTLPHPHLAERDFVLYPLAEISDTRHLLPRGPALDSLIERCDDNSLHRTAWQLETAL